MKLRIAFLILVLAVAPACVLAAGNAQSGQAVFNKSCKACHGATGEGNPVMAKMLNTTLPNLGSKEVQAKSDGDLKKVVAEGKGKMKPVKAVTGGDLDDAIAFVRTLAKK